MAVMRERSVGRERRPASEYEQDVRLRDVGYLLGLLGLGAMTFVLGRASAPGASCCDDLIHRDMELLICEMQSQNSGQPG